jgi:hypothetical protein
MASRNEILLQLDIDADVEHVDNLYNFATHEARRKHAARGTPDA